MRSTSAAPVARGSISALNSARGSLLMLFIMFLAGVFLIFSTVVPVYFFNSSLIEAQMESVKSLFNNAISIYMVFIVFASALGLTTYLVSYVVIGAPIRLIRWLFFKVLELPVVYDYRKLPSYNEIGKYLRTEEDERYAAFLRLSEDKARHASDVRFLFVQLMFARSALLSIIISVWIVPSAIGYDSSQFIVIVAWVLAMSSYAIGHNLYNRTLYISWVLQFENKKAKTEKDNSFDAESV